MIDASVQHQLVAVTGATRGIGAPPPLLPLPLVL